MVRRRWRYICRSEGRGKNTKILEKITLHLKKSARLRGKMPTISAVKLAQA